MLDTDLKSVNSAITYSFCPGRQKGHEGGHKASPRGREMDTVCFVEHSSVTQLSECEEKEGVEYICFLHNSWNGSLATVHLQLL